MARWSDDPISGSYLLLFFGFGRGFRGLCRLDVLDLACVDLFLGDLADFAGVGRDQRRGAAGELAGAARGHQHVAIIAVEPVFQFHRPVTSRVSHSVGEALERKPEYSGSSLPYAASGISGPFLGTVSPEGRAVSLNALSAHPKRWLAAHLPPAPADH